MKTKKLTIAIALMAMTFIGTSCGNKQQKSASEATTEQSASSALEIDSLLANAENLAGQEVQQAGAGIHATAGPHGVCRRKYTGLLVVCRGEQHRTGITHSPSTINYQLSTKSWKHSSNWSPATFTPK